MNPEPCFADMFILPEALPIPLDPLQHFADFFDEPAPVDPLDQFMGLFRLAEREIQLYYDD